MDLRYFGPVVVVHRTKGKSYLCCELNGAMIQGKIAQFRVIPFEQRYRLDLPGDALDIIDVTQEELEALANEEEDEEDEFFEVERGKDLQFHKIRIRPPEERPADDESDTESYVSEVIPDIDLDEIRKGYTDDGPRRSKRLNKPNK